MKPNNQVEEKVLCPKCNRHTLNQVDDRPFIEVGSKLFNCKLCSGCLKPIEYCICEDWI